MSDYLALYRKYRPETFDQVVGQEQIVNLLTKAVEHKKVGHAYLFCGGRGTGKTTVARILAKEVGCNPEDIIEIDAASNRGIDEIRELREAVRSLPFSSPYKVYIIDEAHMLTKEASNALLKTLEEPPAHVIFILATTDPQKLPKTIVSRCQKIEFKQPDLVTLSKRLIHVAQEEGKELLDEAGLLLASFGRGSYRDALGALEQTILSIEGTRIKREDVTSFLGSPNEDTLLELYSAYVSKDTSTIIAILDRLRMQGADACETYGTFIEYFRYALLARIHTQKKASSIPVHVTDALALLAKNNPQEINSTKLLKLLEGEKYLKLSLVDPYIGFEMILLDTL